jgi:hypothetical protein
MLAVVLALVPACTVGGGRHDAGTGSGGDANDSGLAMAPDVVFPDTLPVDAACYAPIDLVFVLDVSTSMTGEFSRLRAGIGSIFAAADALTTDHTFGLVVFVDDALVVHSCASFATAAALQTEFDSWQNFCSSNNNPGGDTGQNLDCPENDLDALYAAATMCTWRMGATHLIIHVTDDTFRERPQVFSHDAFQAGVPAEHTYAEVSDALVGAQIRVGSFAQLTPMDCGAGTSTDTAQGFLTPYMGMPSLPDATGGMAWDIAQVRAGTLDMATAINSLIDSSYCRPF